MRKLVILGLVLLVLGSFAVEAGAWVLVPDRGDTGWQTYYYTAGPGGFSGTAGFVVSNAVDESCFSELLLDNLSHGGGGVNRGFEVGNYSGYDLLGNSYAEVTAMPVLSMAGNEYLPVQGDFMSHQFALGPGVSTAAFQNACGQAGTIGSILETAISLGPGELFFFNWAFLANDLSPWNDFSLFYLKDQTGAIVFSEGLGQLGTPSPVPVPSTLILMGSGLLGLLRLKRRAKRR
jgi:hypothetical protein